MKTNRIRIVCLDIVKIDFTHDLAFVTYGLRTSLGDNHSATDLRIDTVEKMCDELYEAARNKAALLAEVFSRAKMDPAKYLIADYKVTREKLTPLLKRLLEAKERHLAGQLTDEERSMLETDGVHLLRPELDLEGHTADERADILLKRATRHLDQSDPEPACLMAQRALRLRPDDAQAQELLARCLAAKNRA